MDLFASRRRLATRAGVVCVAAALVAVPLASTAVAGTTTPSQEQFRADLGSYLQNLRRALADAARNPVTKGVVAPRLAADTKALAAAERQLPLLSGTQLDAMQALLGGSSSWKQQPDALRSALSQAQTTSTGTNTSASTPAGYLSDCTDTNLGDPRGLFYSYWGAAQAASAAGAVSLAIPSGAEYAPGLIAAGVVYGVTNGLAIGLNDRLSRKLDCLTAESNATLVAAYPVQGPLDPSQGAYTRASTQASVDKLTTAAAGIDTTLETIETVINSTSTELVAVINNLGLAKGNTDAVEATSTDLQTRSDDLLSSIGTPSDQANDSGSGDPSGTANGLANTIDDRADTTLSKTADLQALSVRLEIESALAATPSRPSVALFALPASQGGYLERVRDIATMTVANELNAGQKVNGDAQEKLAQGNDELAAGNYENAYQLYAEAYRHAVG